jgi:two-component system phosphate regulon response regulator PhoB
MNSNSAINKDYKILVIEDDADIRELIRLQLQLQNYKTFVAKTGEEAKALFSQQSFDLFIIDRMLPDTSGIEICKNLRASSLTAKTPIILLTALAEPQNIIEGLDAGADDYITKPFDINILHARVRAQLRRLAPKEKTETITFEGLSLDIKKCRVKVEQEEILLTNTEFQILATLAQEPGIVHTRESLITKILGEDVFVTNRTIDTHIAGLRKKIKGASKLIETIRGVGYRLQDNE